MHKHQLVLPTGTQKCPSKNNLFPRFSTLVLLPVFFDRFSLFTIFSLIRPLSLTTNLTLLDTTLPLYYPYKTTHLPNTRSTSLTTILEQSTLFFFWTSWTHFLTTGPVYTPHSLIEIVSYHTQNTPNFNKLSFYLHFTCNSISYILDNLSKVAWLAYTIPSLPFLYGRKWLF